MKQTILTTNDLDAENKVYTDITIKKIADDDKGKILPLIFNKKQIGTISKFYVAGRGSELCAEIEIDEKVNQEIYKKIKGLDYEPEIIMECVVQ